MALVQQNITVQTTPTLIADIPEGIRYTAVVVGNNHNQPIFIGGSTVAAIGATVGVPLAAGASTTLWLNGGDKVWAVSAALTTANSISVVYSGQ